jgi:hypothetical protein
MRRGFAPIAPVCIALASLSFGCSTTGHSRAAAVAALAAAHTLVWTVADEGALPSTYALDDDGAVVSHRGGIHIWASGTEWAFDVSVEPIATQACEGDAEQPPQESRGVRVRLVPSVASRVPIEIVSPAASDQSNQVDQSARVLASIGPYVFIEESTYSYTCGAHGNVGVSFAVWNVEDGRPIDLLSDLPDRQHLLALGRQAIDARPDIVDFSRPDDPPTVTELLPRLGPHGQLEASALVTVASCYACSDGGWSSYTVSTPVPAELPWRLRGMGPPPRAAVLFADAHPKLTIGGYSIVR